MSPDGVALGSPELLLLPTDRERELFREAGPAQGLALVETCGFGPIAAAARTAELLARVRPRRVWLVGIAGTFDPAVAPLGSAVLADSVAIDGIGAGRGERFLGPRELGLPQWPASDSGVAIEDVIELAAAERVRAAAVPAGLLLTVTAASASEAEAAERRRRFPRALAEDMEGFSVALACSLARVPLTIVRGISNRVGDRRPERWAVAEALRAARAVALELLSAPPQATQWDAPR
jgi:futalosine hydrolase